MDPILQAYSPWYRVRMGRLLNTEAEERRIAEDVLSLLLPTRPGNSAGRVSFHFRLSKVARGKSDYQPSRAQKFQEYIERPEALERDRLGPITTGNFGEEVRERAAFWDEIKKFERRCDARIQERVEFEIPIELRDRPGAIRNVTRKFGRFFSDRNLPFYIAVHKPPLEERLGRVQAGEVVAEHELTGDPRNLHAHVVWSERPFQRLGPYSWQFSKRRDRSVHHCMFPAVLRQEVCRILNVELAANGIAKKYTPHSFLDSGIGQRPLVRLPRNAMYSIARGQAPEIAYAFAEIAAENDLRKLEAAEKTISARLDALTRSLPKVPSPATVLDPEIETNAPLRRFEITVMHPSGSEIVFEKPILAPDAETAVKIAYGRALGYSPELSAIYQFDVLQAEYENKTRRFFGNPAKLAVRDLDFVPVSRPKGSAKQPPPRRESSNADKKVGEGSQPNKEPVPEGKNQSPRPAVPPFRVDPAWQDRGLMEMRAWDDDTLAERQSATSARLKTPGLGPVEALELRIALQLIDRETGKRARAKLPKDRGGPGKGVSQTQGSQHPEAGTRNKKDDFTR